MTNATVFFVQQADGSPEAVIAKGPDRPLVVDALVSVRMSHQAPAWRLDEGAWLASTPEGEGSVGAFDVPDAVRQLSKAVGAWRPTHVVEGIAPEPRYLYAERVVAAGFADGPLPSLREWVEGTAPEFELRGGSYYRQGARFTGNIRALTPAALPNAAAIAPGAPAAAASPSRPQAQETSAVTSPVYAPDGSLVLGTQAGTAPAQTTNAAVSSSAAPFVERAGGELACPHCGVTIAPSAAQWQTLQRFEAETGDALPGARPGAGPVLQQPPQVGQAAPPVASPATPAGLPPQAVPAPHGVADRARAEEQAEREKHAAMTGQPIRDAGQQALEAERLKAEVEKSQAAATLEQGHGAGVATGQAADPKAKAPEAQAQAQKGKGGRLRGPEGSQAGPRGRPSSA